MIQTNTRFEIGLNIHLLSFSLPKDIIKDKDDVRVSITTMPDEIKQHFHVQGKKMNHSNHIFSLNITNQTKHIILVFRKKSFLNENPIIASVTIHTKDFPKIPQTLDQLCSGIINTDVKKINIYYPLQKQIQEMRELNPKIAHKTDEELRKEIKRKVLGYMEIQLSFTAPYVDYKVDEKKNDKSSHKKNNIFKNKKYEKKGNYEKLTDENPYGNYSLL
ncbi:hypothetical protein M9Y10_006156 [Tritrichomonas musculus]|uniref:MSP domain-containing protein n=1 Tax=Tritrichomonas musculus TaxID=1915356 RepID=A0ABR2JDF3_9EUKA